uniref:Uncharacterized protein n=1 Tax=Rhizophora mucronata TaxID=61149 RepID=A0A2P2JDW2_RHIMU
MSKFFRNPNNPLL